MVVEALAALGDAPASPARLGGRRLPAGPVGPGRALPQPALGLCRLPDLWVRNFDLPAGLEHLRDGVVDALSHSLADGTIKQYNGYLARFERACGSYGLASWQQATTGHVLAFLTEIARGTNRPAGPLGGAIAALRIAFESVAANGVANPLASPLIDRVKKGLVAALTTRPRRPTQPLPVEGIRRWVESLPPNESLPYDRLRMKCAVLAALVLIARPSDLTHIDAQQLAFEPDLSGVEVSLLKFKNDYHRDGAVLNIQACSDPRLCFVRACFRLLQLNEGRHRNCRSLFIDYNTGTPLGAGQIGTILKNACKLANLPAVFSGRNFRPGGANRGLQGGLPLDLVMHIGRWRNFNTVYNHYLLSDRPVNTTDVLVGLPSAAPPASTRSVGPSLEDT